MNALGYPQACHSAGGGLDSIRVGHMFFFGIGVISQRSERFATIISVIGLVMRRVSVSRLSDMLPRLSEIAIPGSGCSRISFAIRRADQ
jgi:hypothetical protein